MSSELVLEYVLNDEFNATTIVTDLEQNNRINSDLIIVFEKTRELSEKEHVSHTKKRPPQMKKGHSSQKTKTFWVYLRFRDTKPVNDISIIRIKGNKPHIQIKLVAKPTVLAQYIRILGLEPNTVDVDINENNTIIINGNMSTNNREVTINNDTFPISE